MTCVKYRTSMSKKQLMFYQFHLKAADKHISLSIVGNSRHYTMLKSPFHYKTVKQHLQDTCSEVKVSYPSSQQISLQLPTSIMHEKQCTYSLYIEL